MTTKPLEHVYPRWDTPEDDPQGELREVWEGSLRIVRNTRRVRLLKRRGVPVLHLGAGPDRPGAPGPWGWFVTERGAS